MQVVDAICVDGVFKPAEGLPLEWQWSFWDARIVAGCLEAGVTRLYPEDLPGHKPPAGLKIINLFV